MGDAKVSWSDNFTSYDQYNNFLFSDKVCEKLKKTDRQICELTYEKQIDFSTVDLKKLKVKDLKKILSEWDEVGTLLFPCPIIFWQNLFSGVWWLPGEGRLHQADRGAEAKACPHWALRRPSDICDFFYDGAHKQFGSPDMPNHWHWQCIIVSTLLLGSIKCPWMTQLSTQPCALHRWKLLHTQTKWISSEVLKTGERCLCCSGQIFFRVWSCGS